MVLYHVNATADYEDGARERWTIGVVALNRSDADRILTEDATGWRGARSVVIGAIRKVDACKPGDGWKYGQTLLYESTEG
jgi:hypothetical protein